jgi:hypothetical protein
LISQLSLNKLLLHSFLITIIKYKNRFQNRSQGLRLYKILKNQLIDYLELLIKSYTHVMLTLIPKEIDFLKEAFTIDQLVMDLPSMSKTRSGPNSKSLKNDLTDFNLVLLKFSSQTIKCQSVKIYPHTDVPSTFQFA